MSDLFEACLRFTLHWEGGFSDNPSDPGGKTMEGITQATYDKYRRDKKLPRASVQYISNQEVRDIYYNYYWLASGACLYTYPLALVIFDSYCQFNPTTVYVFESQAFGLVNPTKYSLLELLKKNDNSETASKILEHRKAYRYQRIKQYPPAKVFLEGWLFRDEALAKEIDTQDYAKATSDIPV